MSSNNVVYIGNYKDGTGWANASLHNILAMDSVGIDVIPRAITYEQETKGVPERILELEQKSTHGAEICIQHTLPSAYSYNSNFKNIGFYETETDDFRKSLWPKYINTLDEAWVPNAKGVTASQFSGVNVPIHVVPHCLPIEKYDRNGENHFIAPEIKDTFNFLFVGELVERKNLEALIRAYHGEFHPKEKVNLVIKSSLPNSHGQNPFFLMQEYVDDVKGKMKIRENYKGEMIFAEHLPKSVYLSILRQCHCFVMPSRGEACCIPALEAGLMGLPVLYTANNGMKDYCGLSDDSLGNAVNSVDSYKSPCYNALDTIEGLQRGDETWQEINVLDLQTKMRLMYESWKIDGDRYKELSEIQRLKSETFSYEQIGNLIKERLK